MPADMPFPFKDAPFRLSMGLQLLEPLDWIRMDEAYDRDTALKRRLYQQRSNDVFAAMPGFDAQQAEVLAFVVAHLCRYYPQQFAEKDGSLARRYGEMWQPCWEPAHLIQSPLLAAAMCLQEDLVLMHGTPDGRYILAAASVSFPTRWQLHEKMGKPLSEIHAPVPGLEQRIGRQISRLFQTFSPDKPLVRENWSVMDDDALFQPTGHGRREENQSLTPENVGERLWLRVERQCLHRLAESADILFSIRIYQSNLDGVVTSPARARMVQNALETMPADLQHYKSLPVFRHALREYLQVKISENA